MFYLAMAIIVALILGTIYWYKKEFCFAFSEIVEKSQTSKFKWTARTSVENCDGSISRVFGYRSEDNNVDFFIYLDSNDSRVKEFENKDEIIVNVDYQYIKDYFKGQNVFPMLGKTPFAEVSGISCVGYDNLEIYNHDCWDTGCWSKIPFSKENANNLLKSRIGVPKDVTELGYGL